MSKVAIVLGSRSDLKIVKESGMLNILNEVGVSWEISIISAHRNPDDLKSYCRVIRDETKVFIGVAGMAAALPGALASELTRHTPIVIGVPLSSDVLDGMDALLAMVRMPPGVPVAVTGIDKSGLYNAAILACKIIAPNDEEISMKFSNYISSKYKPAEIGIESSERVE